MERIERFEGVYRFLSNFYPCKIEITLSDGSKHIAPSLEHAFQALKTDNLEEQLLVLSQPSPNLAKKEGRKVKLRSDWNKIKVELMAKLLHSKFTQNPRLADKLIGTGRKILQEGNHWEDTFWGVDLKTGEGCNHVGLLLMDLRRKLRHQHGLD